MRYRRKKNCWQQDISRKEFFLAVLRGVLTAILFSYLFYESILSAVLLLPYLVWFLKSWEKQYIKKKKQLFQSQFKEAVQSL